MSEKYDIIGDVHGCYDELVELILILGYKIENEKIYHPYGRKIILLGDLVDRGPKIMEVLALAIQITREGSGFSILGNHEFKFRKYLSGKNIKLSESVQRTIDQLNNMPVVFLNTIKEFLHSLPYYKILDQGNLVVAHAGIKEDMIGKESEEIRSFCIYGDTNGETDEYGLPVRRDWALNYRGNSWIIYGHTPVPSPYWQNKSVNIDTGCVFGNTLTALKYPEMETVSVKARKVYYSSPKDFY
jgi:protein phosphatase